MPGYTGRLISKAAKSQARIEGNAMYNVAYTTLHQAKAKHISRQGLFKDSLVCFVGLALTPFRLVSLNNRSRDVILDQLRGIEVYQLQKVSLGWSIITLYGQTVDGRAEYDRVSLAAEPNRLKIYLFWEDSNARCPPLELTEELAAFCGITYPENVKLLTYILVQQDTERIVADLDRRGIPNDVTVREDGRH
jgi:hypothetical protein